MAQKAILPVLQHAVALGQPKHFGLRLVQKRLQADALEPEVFVVELQSLECQIGVGAGGSAEKAAPEHEVSMGAVLIGVECRPVFVDQRSMGV